jgi:adenine phosphoribosyltransferase
MTYQKALNEYVKVEQEAHIFNSSSIVNKVTQEVLELKQGKRKKNQPNVEEETRDAIVNILSATYKTWVLPSESLLDRTMIVAWDDVDDALSNWNEDIQWMNQEYSRKIVSGEQLKASTEQLISTLLSFGSSQETLQEIVAHNTEKFRARISKYKPQINVQDYIDNVRFKDVNFKDSNRLLQSPEAMKFVVNELAIACKKANVEVIACFDARGFLFGPLVAIQLGIPVCIIRKEWALPDQVVKAEYSKEYKDSPDEDENKKKYIEIQVKSIKPWQNVWFIDDVLATGKTYDGWLDLMKQVWWNVVLMAAVLELEYCNARELLKWQNIYSVTQYK